MWHLATAKYQSMEGSQERRGMGGAPEVRDYGNLQPIKLSVHGAYAIQTFLSLKLEGL